MAIFGDLYKKNKDEISKLPADQQLEKLNELADKSAELSPAAQFSGGTGLVKTYIKQLIERSEKLDEKEEKDTGKHVDKGAHLKAWAEDVAAATKDVDFTKVYSDKPGESVSPFTAKMYMDSLGKDKVQEIGSKIHASAEKNISADFKGSSIEEDLVKSLRADSPAAAVDKAPKQEEAQPKKGAFDDVKDEPHQQPGGMMKMLVMAFVMMIMGGDPSSLFGAQTKTPTTEEKDAEAKGVTTPGQQAQIDKMQAQIDKLEKEKDISSIMSKHGITKGDFSKLLGDMPSLQSDQPAATLGKSADNFVILTPNANGTDVGNTVIYAKQGADGKLTDIQVATTGSDGKMTLKEPVGDFTLNGNDQKAMDNASKAIMDKAANAPVVAADKAAASLAEHISSGLHASQQAERANTR